MSDVGGPFHNLVAPTSTTLRLGKAKGNTMVHRNTNFRGSVEDVGQVRTASPRPGESVAAPAPQIAVVLIYPMVVATWLTPDGGSL